MTAGGGGICGGVGERCEVKDIFRSNLNGFGVSKELINFGEIFRNRPKQTFYLLFVKIGIFKLDIKVQTKKRWCGARHLFSTLLSSFPPPITNKHGKLFWSK
jgi:hypothetical protein